MHAYQLAEAQGWECPNSHLFGVRAGVPTQPPCSKGAQHHVQLSNVTP